MLYIFLFAISGGLLSNSLAIGMYIYFSIREREQSVRRSNFYTIIIPANKLVIHRKYGTLFEIRSNFIRISDSFEIIPQDCQTPGVANGPYFSNLVPYFTVKFQILNFET